MHAGNMDGNKWEGYAMTEAIKVAFDKYCQLAVEGLKKADGLNTPPNSAAGL